MFFCFFLLFYNALDLNNQKMLCLPSIFQFYRTVHNLKHPLARNVSSNQVVDCHNHEITPLHFFELIAFNSKSIATLSQFYVKVQCQWCKGNEKFLFTFFPTEQPLPIVKTTSLEQDGDHPLTSLDFCDISIKPIVFSTKIFNRVDHSIQIYQQSKFLASVVYFADPV